MEVIDKVILSFTFMAKKEWGKIAENILKNNLFFAIDAIEADVSK